MITTKVMPLESMRMERVSHLLRLPYYYRCFPNIASISSHLLKESKETQKTKVIQLVPTELSASQPLVIPSQTRTAIQMFQKAIQGEGHCNFRCPRMPQHTKHKAYKREDEQRWRYISMPHSWKGKTGLFTGRGRQVLEIIGTFQIVLSKNIYRSH